MAMAKQNLKLDSALFLIVLTLLVIGVVMVYSASSFKAQEIYQDSHYFLKNHFYKVLLGLFLMVIFSKTNYRFWLKFSPVFLILAFGTLIYLLASTDVPEIRGSRRWMSVGGFQFQPSDFAKLALILFLGFSLGKSNLARGKTGRGFLFHLAVIALIVIPILLQPDIGTAILISCIGLTLVFVSGERLRHLFIPGITAAGFFAVVLMQEGYQKARIMKFISSIKGERLHWQTQQSLIALGNGGFWGLGLGSSRQKYDFLPDPFTDFIYAILGEELGLIGAAGILALVVCFIWLGFKIALTTADKSGRLLAFGIVLNVAIYSFTNTAVVLNLLPTTGIPMPFLSYGGSSLLVNLIGVGILLNISQKNQKSSRLYPARNHWNPKRGLY